MHPSHAARVKEPRILGMEKTKHSSSSVKSTTLMAKMNISMFQSKIEDGCEVWVEAEI